MTKLLGFIGAVVLCATLVFAQSNAKAGGGQTSSPGTGQPGTGNVPGTGAGQGTGSDITTTPKTTGKAKNSKSRKAGKKGKKAAKPADAGSNGSTPK